MNKVLLLKQYLKTKYNPSFRSKKGLARYQHKQIKNHISFVLEHSPFYQSLYQDFLEDIKKGDWSHLPIINKQIMMDNFDTLNTVSINKEEAFKVSIEAERSRNFSPTINGITIGLSSGTSGNRGIFLVSPTEQSLWAGTVLGKVLPSSILNTHTIAFFLRANSNLYESTDNQKVSFHFFDLLDSFENHITRLNDIQPTIVVAPPSLLRKIAEWKQEGLIYINPLKIVSVAEVLEDIDKHYISNVFQQTIHQVYQCTEGFLASTCKHGTLHLNEDLVYIEKEYLDKDRGLFVPLITDFSRKTQPIIRYRLNDILIERQEKCPCNSPFTALERIDGRCDDIFIGQEKDTNCTIPIFPDFIRRAVMLSSEHIEEFKVIQHPSLDMEVKLKTSKDTKEDIKHKVQQELNNLWSLKNCQVPHIFFSNYDVIPSDKKLKRIEKLG